MPTYKTPDVYIEEIPVFPPSVAEVETSIPAFIGYTEKAKGLTGRDLTNEPTRVKSLLDYETYFGRGPEVKPTKITLKENNDFESADFESNFYLYDSLRLFFDNGGGPCYIVSVGGYSASPSGQSIIDGLNQIKKVDEPTILLFPDAADLATEEFGNVQKQALVQCGALGDRVAIFDLQKNDPLGQTFRDNIGIMNLKYGAAYSPWLKVSYPKNILYVNVRDALGSENLKALATEKLLQDKIVELDNVILDGATVSAQMKALFGDDTPGKKYEKLVTAFKTNKALADAEALFKFLFDLAKSIEGLLTASKSGAFKGEISKAIQNTLKPAYLSLISNDKELAAVTGGTYKTQIPTGANEPKAPEWDKIFSANAPAASKLIKAADNTDEKKVNALLPSINTNFGIINQVINTGISSASEYQTQLEKDLSNSFPAYQSIIAGLNRLIRVVPPSGAIAGVYATVDNQRGVWKAPANISLNGVTAPDKTFDINDTDSLNVDPNAGKSINAIRAFSGKGTLVWGARTLAGNDNEWRYISVRRFFNMVEESVKKSTYWAVFEPNDANTWVKVRGMIENFLTQKWREGALAGATPKEAFFVRCGLGTTMTAQDVLEGRMYVEIGMAVVRPAEFIILRFFHKLQTS